MGVNDDEKFGSEGGSAPLATQERRDARGMETIFHSRFAECVPTGSIVALLALSEGTWCPSRRGCLPPGKDLGLGWKKK